jgi:hypothetical protein
MMIYFRSIALGRSYCDKFCRRLSSKMNKTTDLSDIDSFGLRALPRADLFLKLGRCGITRFDLGPRRSGDGRRSGRGLRRRRRSRALSSRIVRGCLLLLLIIIIFVIPVVESGPPRPRGGARAAAAASRTRRRKEARALLLIRIVREQHFARHCERCIEGVGGLREAREALVHALRVGQRSGDEGAQLRGGGGGGRRRWRRWRGLGW